MQYVAHSNGNHTLWPLTHIRHYHVTNCGHVIRYRTIQLVMPHLKANFLACFLSNCFYIKRPPALLVTQQEWQSSKSMQRSCSCNKYLFYNKKRSCVHFSSSFYCRYLFSQVFYNNFHSYNDAFIQISHFIKTLQLFLSTEGNCVF